MDFFSAEGAVGSEREKRQWSAGRLHVTSPVRVFEGIELTDGIVHLHPMISNTRGTGEPFEEDWFPPFVPGVSRLANWLTHTVM